MVLEQFNRESQRFTVPAAENTFPQRVVYQGHCGPFCRASASEHDVRAYQKLIDAFNNVVLQCGGAAVANKTDLLLRFTLRNSAAETCLDVYAFATAVSSQSGVHAPSQVFVRLDILPAASLQEDQAAG
jgi:hypothetical protein